MTSICETLKTLVSIDAKGCWIWQGGKVGSRGFLYGYLTSNGSRVLAHRLSFEEFNGPIPEGLFVLHKCDVPLCINPDHLFVGTNTDNMRDMAAKGRTSVRCGPENHATKLSREAVDEIRLALSGGTVRGRRKTGSTNPTVSEFAKRFGVSRRAVRFALTGETWRAE